MSDHTCVPGLNRWGPIHSTRDNCGTYFKDKIDNPNLGNEGFFSHVEAFGLRLGAGFSYLGANIVDLLAHVVSVVAIAILFIPAEFIGMLTTGEHSIGQTFYKHCGFSQGLMHTVEIGCILLTALPTSVMLAFHHCSCACSSSEPPIGQDFVSL